MRLRQRHGAVLCGLFLLAACGDGEAGDDAVASDGIAQTTELAEVAQIDDSAGDDIVLTIAPTTTGETVVEAATTLPAPSSPIATTTTPTTVIEVVTTLAPPVVTIAPTAAPPPDVADQAPVASESASFIRDYLLDAGARDYSAAWNRLAVGYQQKYGGFDAFTRFWDRIETVGINATTDLGSAVGSPAGNTLAMELRFVVRDAPNTTEIVHIDVRRIDGRLQISDYRFIGAA